MLVALANTANNRPPPTPFSDNALPRILPEKSLRDLYREAAYSLPETKDKIEAWDTNGCRSSRPELRREGFTEV